MSQTKQIAIIGLGNIGKVLATNFARSKRSFIAADRNLEKAQNFAAQYGEFAEGATIAAAIEKSEIIILSIPYGSIAPFLKDHAQALAGKIIVDPSNPIAPDEKGGFRKIIAADQSAGELNAAALPAGAKLSKALGTLSAGSLSSAAFQKPDPAVLFFATNETGIDGDVNAMIKDAGFDPVKVGDISKSIRLEVFGDLHEFGALGKTVTAVEARKAV